jgi:hypothetical protein
VSLINNFPTLLASLPTSQPLQLQLAVLIGSSAVGLLAEAAALGLIAGAVPLWSPAARLEGRLALEIGLAIGAVAAGAIVVSAISGSGPLWPSYAAASAFVPLLSAATMPVAALILRITILMLVVATANRISAGWTRRRVLVGALLVIVGGVLGNAGSPLNLAAWIASAATIGALLLAAYLVVLRHHGRVVPFAAALMTTAATLRDGWTRAYPGVFAGALIACVVMWIVASAWFRALDLLHRRTAERPSLPVEEPAV